MAAALGNVEDDKVEWHVFDTIKGGDYLVDEDAAEILCTEAVDAVLDLEKMGLRSTARKTGTSTSAGLAGTPPNTAWQRASCLLFGRPHRTHDPADAATSSASSSRWSSSTSTTCSTSVLTEDPQTAAPGEDVAVAGVVALELSTGQIHTFRAKSVIFATGGAGKVFRPPPTRTPSRATAWRSRCAPAFRSRTWSSSSSTRPALPGWASCCQRPLAARAASCATPRANASWSATAHDQGPRAARHRGASDGRRGARGPRRGSSQGLRAA